MDRLCLELKGDLKPLGLLSTNVALMEHTLKAQHETLKAQQEALKTLQAKVNAILLLGIIGTAAVAYKKK